MGWFKEKALETAGENTPEVSEAPDALPSWTGSMALHLIFIALLGLIAYSNTFDVPFQWDESDYIFDNPFARSLDYFLHPSKAEWHDLYAYFKSRYVGYLTFALNYRLHGMDVTGYHVVNLLIHILTALLVYLFVTLTFRTPFLAESGLRKSSKYIAFFAGLFFIAHPIQTEAVTYVYQRFASLAALCYLSSLVFYIKWRLKTERGIHLYFFSLLFAVLAVKTKENAFTLPLAMLLYDLMFFGGRRPLFKRSMFLVPYFMIMLVIPLTIIGTGKSPGEVIGEATKTQDMLSRHDYLLTQFPVITTYLRLIIFPVNQNLDYAYPVYISLLAPEVFFSLLFLLSLLGFSIYLHHRSKSGERALRVVSFGILWFFITLSVESSVIALADLIFEHRVYLPSVGAFMAIAACVVFFLDRLHGGRAKFAACTVIAIVPFVLAYASFERNKVWGSEISLWENVVRKSPTKARGHNNLGNAYKAEGLLDKAIAHYQIALILKPAHADINLNLAVAYRLKGLTDKALTQFQRVLNFKPDDADAHLNLGAVYESKGLFDKAIEHYKAALKLNPDAMAYAGLATAYYSKGLTDKAIEHYQAALKLKPDATAHYNLGTAYGSKGLTDKAIEHYQIAIRLKPDYANAHYNLGLVYFKKGAMDRARMELEEALKLNPSDIEAKQYLELISKTLPR